MYKALTLLLFLAAGLVLGWYANERMGRQPEIGTSPAPAADDNAYAPRTDGRRGSDEAGIGLPAPLPPATLVEAVERYENAQLLSDAAAMQQARDDVLRLARQHIQAGDYEMATRSLQRFLLAAYRDVDASLLLADAYYRQQDYLGAIEQLYEARAYAFRPEMLTRITRRIRQVVDKQAGQFSNNQNSASLLQLFQKLTQLEPDYAPYFIELAIVQLALADSDGAQRSLALVVNDPDVGEQARLMLASLQQAGTTLPGSSPAAALTEVDGVPLVRSGQHFLVDAYPADAGSLRLLIDTGASMTIISSAALQQRGLRYRETGRSQLFSTANGRVHAPVYLLESLSVGDWYVRQLEVGVLDLDGHAGMDGLLGMNFLSQFRFFIDQNASMLRLSLD